MTLPSPDLDDRTFDQLLASALARLKAKGTDWTDLSPSDPGVVLLELVAYLAEQLIYRLNRVPAKAYVELLRLVGVQLQPPRAAEVVLRFSVASAATAPIAVPEGVQVTTAGAGGPTFTTVAGASIPAGSTSVDVPAVGCEVVAAELLGTTSGVPGQVLEVRSPPIAAATPDGRELVVGVEALPGELLEREPARQHGARSFALWRPVPRFTGVARDERAFLVDRVAGRITFAPAVRASAPGGLEDDAVALAAVPPAGREVRAWYWRGGGRAGNVLAGTLAVLRTPLPGVTVTNPAPAAGGQDAERLEEALVRGPQELHALERAVTARDFELVASQHPAVHRARALTSRRLWSFAAPGSVDVLLVPDVPPEQRPAPLDATELEARQVPSVLEAVAAELEQRRPLGTSCAVRWTRYKTVSVRVQLVVHRGEDERAVAARVLERLQRTISPLGDGPEHRGWPFGQALRASHVYDLALTGERGVRYVEPPRFVVDPVPAADVLSIAPDPFEDRWWWVGSGARVFRSTDDGAGWVPELELAGEHVAVVRPHPRIPGVVAVAATRADGTSSLSLTRDGGQTWWSGGTFDRRVHDAAWAPAEGAPVLLVACDNVLYSCAVAVGRPLERVQVVVDPADPTLGFSAVVATDVRGLSCVAVAAQGGGGVHLSTDGARSFRRIGLVGEDVQVLAVQVAEARQFLWAGVGAVGTDPGKGAFRWELRGAEDDRWVAYGGGWNGASCHSLAFEGRTVLAASTFRGVLQLDLGEPSPSWEPCDVRSGLPTRDPGPFNRLEAVAVAPGTGVVLVGGAEGVYRRSEEDRQRYVDVSSEELLDVVTLPPTWLLCSGDHRVEVTTDHGRGDR